MKGSHPDRWQVQWTADWASRQQWAAGCTDDGWDEFTNVGRTSTSYSTAGGESDCLMIVGTGSMYRNTICVNIM